MRIKVDQENDALYLRLDERAIIESEEVKPGVILDYDEAGQVIGIELLGINGRIPAEMLRSISFEAA